jgi:nitrous oxidase accessory protein NosD
VDNDVTMSAPEGTIFGTNSAGIDIRGSAQGSVVLKNRIRGRAGVALSVAGQGMGIPSNTALVLNNLKGFQSSRADVFIDAGVTNTLVVGRQGTLIDNGVGTVIVPLP